MSVRPSRRARVPRPRPRRARDSLRRLRAGYTQSRAASLRGRPAAVRADRSRAPQMRARRFRAPPPTLPQLRSPYRRIASPAPERLPRFSLGGPAPRDRAPRKAAAESDEDDEIVGLDQAGAHGLRKRHRNRGGRRIAIFGDVNDDFLFGKLEIAGRRVNDAAIRLMRDQERDLALGNVCFLQHRAGRFDHSLDGELERLASLHMNEMNFCLDRRMVERLARAAPLRVEQLRTAAVGTKFRGEKTVFVRAFKNHRARAVAEEYR